MKQQDLGRGTSGTSFLKNQGSRFPETKAIMRDFIVVKERSSGKLLKAIKREAIKKGRNGGFGSGGGI
ncbi:hypothetical protein [Bartonella apihabitans]|uniref:hypothetical protein n=1 Tax=Bartonella apihabitans TaxID=2750929 RepID=UPI00122E7984|nr:hypothetical protein [Bartonella apihabitans]